MRIAKYISHSGYCSRRNAEKLINEKKVKINSIVCQNLATKVSDQDTVKINNHIITLEKNIRLWYFYKPVGIITSSKDEKHGDLSSNLPLAMAKAAKKVPMVVAESIISYFEKGT